MNVLQDPWIETDSGHHSLAEALIRAHRIRALTDSYAPVNVAVLRLMMVIVRRALRGPCDETAWRALWEPGQFPEKPIRAYLDEWAGRFELFGKGRFYQAPIHDDERKPTTYLAPILPSDTNIAHFRHGQDASSGLCPRCAAKGLITLSSFATAGGRGYSAGINDIPPVYFIVTGENLFQTILLNVLPEPWVEGDKPVWEGNSKAGSAIGICEGFTWQPRTVRLNDPEPGTCSLCGDDANGVIRTMSFSAGRSRKKDGRSWRDPNAAFTDLKKSQALRPPNPQAYPSSFASFWRKQAAVLVDGLGEKGALPPAVVRARELLKGGATELPAIQLEAVSLHTDGKAKFFAAARRIWEFGMRLATEPAMRERGRRLMEELDAWVTHQSLAEERPDGQAGDVLLKSRFNSKRAEAEARSESVFRDWLSNPELIDEKLQGKMGIESALGALGAREEVTAVTGTCRSFVEALKAFVGTKRLLDLREGLSATSISYPDTFKVFTSIYWDETRQHNRLPREACWTVATLFPLNVLGGGERNSLDLASLVRRELPRRSVNDEARRRLGRRWDELLQSDLPGLRTHLPFFVRQLRRRGIPLDWARLLSDLSDWRDPIGSVQHRWRCNGPTAPRIPVFKNPSQKEIRNARRNTSAAKSQSVESES